MAHLVYGIDIGAYEVKVVAFEASFRANRMVERFSERVPAGPEPLPERQGHALAEIASRLSPDAVVVTGLPGDGLSVRSLELPFTDARKIDQVVGYELEGQMVHALEDVVLDHMAAKAPGGTTSNVLALAARKDDVAAFLEIPRAAGIEPRAVYAAPVSYRAPAVEGEAPAAEPAEVEAVIDIGHLRTNVCVLRGHDVVFARTLMRGGHQLTVAVAEAFRVDEERAEAGKVQEGYVSTAAGAGVEASGRQRLAEVLREALEPLVRDLRQTFVSFRAAFKHPIARVLLTGGTARLPGLGDLLRSELDVQVGVLPVASPLGKDEGVSTFALATAYAEAQMRGRREVDFRKGPFVYRAQMSALRGKGLHLAALGVSLLVAAAGDAMATLSRLDKERVDLDKQLETTTKDLFGAPRTDARAITLLLKKREETLPLPKATAFDLLGEISKRIPAEVKLDVTELDIKPKKTFIKGTIDSAAAVEEIVGKLKEVSCFEEISKGPITEVSGGVKQFTLNITSRCP